MTIYDHPAAALMAEVKAEQAIASTPEALALQEAIYAAVRAYHEYLDRHGLIWNGGVQRDGSCEGVRAGHHHRGNRRYRNLSQGRPVRSPLWRWHGP
jgi:hypothetical protein